MPAEMSKRFMRLFKNKNKSDHHNKENERFSETFVESDRRTVKFESSDDEPLNPYREPAQPRKYAKGPQSCPGGVQDGNRKEPKRGRGHPGANYFDEANPRCNSHHNRRTSCRYSDDEESENQRQHRLERKLKNLERENSTLLERCQRLQDELDRAKRTSSRYRRERNEFRDRCNSQQYHMPSYMGTWCPPHFAPAPSSSFYTTFTHGPSALDDTPSTSSHNSISRGRGPTHGSSFLYPRESLSDLEIKQRFSQRTPSFVAQRK
ncbi:hypothetical protein L596_002189 [Steinernema carpocapsae]|uniref:Uncharacterized protein n=1 Tax=Steinernema carpocapsae TaxID=34508 RepID=A0A4U8UNH4_STECR|nr:hypothetical protein L596_002189 [Steinernema carpocapsae]